MALMLFKWSSASFIFIHATQAFLVSGTKLYA